MRKHFAGEGLPGVLAQGFYLCPARPVPVPSGGSCRPRWAQGAGVPGSVWVRGAAGAGGRRPSVRPSRAPAAGAAVPALRSGRAVPPEGYRAPAAAVGSESSLKPRLSGRKGREGNGDLKRNVMLPWQYMLTNAKSVYVVGVL